MCGAQLKISQNLVHVATLHIFALIKDLHLKICVLLTATRYMYRIFDWFAIPSRINKVLHFSSAKKPPYLAKSFFSNISGPKFSGLFIRINNLRRHQSRFQAKTQEWGTEPCDVLARYKAVVSFRWAAEEEAKLMRYSEWDL